MQIIGFSGGPSNVYPWPAGTQAGDLALLMGMGNSSSGWPGADQLTGADTTVDGSSHIYSYWKTVTSDALAAATGITAPAYGFCYLVIIRGPTELRVASIAPASNTADCVIPGFAKIVGSDGLVVFQAERDTVPQTPTDLSPAAPSGFTAIAHGTGDYFWLQPSYKQSADYTDGTDINVPMFAQSYPGRAVAFEGYVPFVDPDQPIPEITTKTVDSSIVTSTGTTRAVRLHPSGEWAAFTGSLNLVLAQNDGAGNFPSKVLPAGVVQNVEYDFMAFRPTDTPERLIYSRGGGLYALDDLGTNFGAFKTITTGTGMTSEDMDIPPDGAHLAQAGNGTIYVWGLDEGSGPYNLENPPQEYNWGGGFWTGTRYSPDGQFLAGCLKSGGGMKIWRRAGDTYTNLGTPQLTNRDGYVSWSGDSKFVAASGLTSNSVRVWQHIADNTFVLLGKVFGAAKKVFPVFAGPNGEFLFVFSMVDTDHKVYALKDSVLTEVSADLSMFPAVKYVDVARDAKNVMAVAHAGGFSVYNIAVTDDTVQPIDGDILADFPTVEFEGEYLVSPYGDILADFPAVEFVGLVAVAEAAEPIQEYASFFPAAIQLDGAQVDVINRDPTYRVIRIGVDLPTLELDGEFVQPGVFWVDLEFPALEAEINVINLYGYVTGELPSLEIEALVDVETRLFNGEFDLPAVEFEGEIWQRTAFTGVFDLPAVEFEGYIGSIYGDLDAEFPALEFEAYGGPRARFVGEMEFGAVEAEIVVQSLYGDLSGELPAVEFEGSILQQIRAEGALDIEPLEIEALVDVETRTIIVDAELPTLEFIGDMLAPVVNYLRGDIGPVEFEGELENPIVVWMAAEFPAVELEADVRKAYRVDAFLDIPALEFAGFSYITVQGDAILDLPAVEATGELRARYLVDVDGEVGALECEAVLKLAFTARIDAEFPAVEFDGEFKQPVLVDGLFDLPALELDGLFAQPIVTSGDLDLPAVEAEGELTLRYVVAIDADLPAVEFEAAVKLRAMAALSADLPALEAAIVAKLRLEAAALLDLAALEATGELKLTIAADLSGTLGEVEFSGRLRLGSSSGGGSGNANPAVPGEASGAYTVGGGPFLFFEGDLYVG